MFWKREQIPGRLWNFRAMFSNSIKYRDEVRFFRILKLEQV